MSIPLYHSNDFLKVRHAFVAIHCHRRHCEREVDPPLPPRHLQGKKQPINTFIMPFNTYKQPLLTPLVLVTPLYRRFNTYKHPINTNCPSVYKYPTDPCPGKGAVVVVVAVEVVVGVVLQLQLVRRVRRARIIVFTARAAAAAAAAVAVAVAAEEAAALRVWTVTRIESRQCTLIGLERDVG